MKNQIKIIIVSLGILLGTVQVAWSSETTHECNETNFKEYVFSKEKIDDLIKRTQKGCDLRGADLTGAYLYGAYLYGAYLTEADLTGAYLKGADLRRANLTGANLNGANLYGANLTGAVIQYFILTDFSWVPLTSKQFL